MRKFIDEKHRDTIKTNRNISIIILVEFLIILLIYKLYLLINLPANQDEFSFLSIVHQFWRGEKIQPYHSFHVYVFKWLFSVSTNEVKQIIAARLFLYLLLICSCYFIFRVCEYLIDTIGGIYVVLCYVSLQYNMFNMCSYRHDSIAAFFITLVFYIIIIKQSLRYQFLSGIFFAFAWMFTIKTSIYVIVITPVFISMFLFQPTVENKNSKVVCFIVGFLLSLMVLQLFHFYNIQSMAGKSESAISFLHKSYRRFVVFDELFPQLNLFKFSLTKDFPIWSLFLIGWVIIFYEKSKTRKIDFKTVVILILSIPLISLVFYRNGFPYFYQFITIYAFLPAGLLLSRISNKLCARKVRAPLIVFCFCVILLRVTVGYDIGYPSAILKDQTKTLDAIHRIYGPETTYIDGCYMAPSFRMVGFFMSSAGMELYQKASIPFLKEAMLSHEPQFLIENVLQLGLTSSQPPKNLVDQSLSLEDFEFLKSYFIHHWGKIWVVGKVINFENGEVEKTFQLYVTGKYTVEVNSLDSISIDRKYYKNGDTVFLIEGKHEMVFHGRGNSVVTLRYGDHIYKPSAAPLSDRLFWGPFL